MRLITALLIVTLCALSLSAQRLTNELILNQLDDATASEARWVLMAEEGDSHVGDVMYDPSRVLIAYWRLRADKSPEVFELLAQSENPYACEFGLMGLDDLDAATSERLFKVLPACMSHSITDDEYAPFPAMSILELISNIKTENLEPLKAAWQKALDSIINDPPYVCVATEFKSILGELPKGDTADREQAREFALLHLIEDEEERCNKIQELAGYDNKPVLQKLCLAVLMPETKSLLEGIWVRELSDENIFNLKILAAKVDRIHKQVLNGSYNGLFYYSDPYTKLHQLTAKDWQWLEGHNNQDVSSAGKILHQNVITGWQIDSIPTDKIDIQLWLQLCMHHAQDEESAFHERAKFTIRREINKDIHVFPVSSYEDYYFVKELSKIIGESTFIELGAKAIKSNDSADNWVGLQLIRYGGSHDTVLNNFNSAKELSTHLIRIWKNATPEWAFGIKTSILNDSDLYIEDYFFETMKVEVAKWFTYFIDKLVTAPRWIPCYPIEFYYDSIYAYTHFVESEEPSKKYLLLYSILGTYETALCTAEEEEKKDFILPASEFYKRQKASLAKQKK